VRENRTHGSMSRVGKRLVGSSWSPVAACGDRVGDDRWTALHSDSTRPICGVVALGRSLQRTRSTLRSAPGTHPTRMGDAALHLDRFEQSAVVGFFDIVLLDVERGREGEGKLAAGRWQLAANG